MRVTDTSPNILTSLSSVRSIASDWASLSASDSSSSYFSTPDWVISWTEHFAPHSAIEVAVWRDPTDRIDGIAAMYEAEEPVHRRIPARVRFWSNLGSGPGAADHCSWPATPERERDIRSWLAAKAADKPLLLRSFDPAESRLIPETARLVSTKVCPRLMIPKDPDEIGASPKFRKQLRYYRRRLEEAGARFRWVASDHMDMKLLEQLFDLHTARREAVDSDTTFDRSRLAFHMSLIASGTSSRGPAAIVAEHNGDVIGILYGFVWQDTFAYYQSGWDPDWTRMSLGTVLIAETIVAAQARGIQIFDFLRGDEDYKYRFGAQPYVDQTWLSSKGIAGLLLRLKNSR